MIGMNFNWRNEPKCAHKARARTLDRLFKLSDVHVAMEIYFYLQIFWPLYCSCTSFVRMHNGMCGRVRFARSVHRKHGAKPRNKNANTERSRYPHASFS